MKKLLCCLLAFSMLQMPMASFAKEEDQMKTNTSNATGQLIADVDFTLVLESKDMDMNLSLEKDGEHVSTPLFATSDTMSGSIEGKEIQWNAEVEEGTQISNVHITMDNLPLGTYTLTLQGSGFHTLVQEVEINNYSKYLHIDDTSVFLMGDVNDDGVVNDEDYQLVWNAIDQKDPGRYDINKDGVVDIQDLSYVHVNLGNVLQPAKESLANPILTASDIDLAIDEDDYLVKGSIVDLVQPQAKPLVVGFQDHTQTISQEHPVDIPIVMKEPVQMNKINIDPGDGEDGITSGMVSVMYLDESNQMQELTYPFDTIQRYYRSARAQDSIVIDLGKQIAVKEIKIKVTGNRNNTNLAEISKVTFLNDVYEKIPEPQAAYPKNVQAIGGNESIAVSWNEVVNVTGYEVKYIGYDVKTKQMAEKTIKTQTNEVTLTGLKNYESYIVSVQSINGDWSSGYGESVKVVPMPTSVPEQATGVNATGGYRQIRVNWQKAKNASSYHLYYRIKDQGEYKEIQSIKETSYLLEDLEDGETYQIYVRAANEIGLGPKSSIVAAKTTDLALAVTPKYHLINRSMGSGVTTKGIKDVIYPVNINPNDYDFEYDKFDIVDDDETSYWNFNSWDAGGFNAGKPSPIVEFEETHEFGEFVVLPSYNTQGGYGYVQIRYWDEQGNIVLVKDASMKSCKDVNGRVYYRIKLASPITSSKIQINLAQSWVSPNYVRISELKFYEYDSLEKDINALFADDLQVELNPDVTQATIDALRTRLETKSQGEKHPDYETLNQDLTYAEEILNDADLSDEIMVVDQTISTANDSGKGYSYGLSDLQPLGFAAKANDEITVYLGKDAKVKGKVQLVFSQPYATPDKWKIVQDLKVGKNVITVPDITSKDIEHGGSLYIRYTGTTPSYDPSTAMIKVRISRAVDIPYLNLSGMSDETQMKQVIGEYIDELEQYVTQLRQSSSDYSEAAQALNVSELATDQMLFSLPATKVLEGIKGTSNDRNDWIERLYQNELAAEQLMDMTYAQKGFSKDAQDVLDQKSRTRMNIRYMDVQNAFMYAGGAHVGIPYGSASGLMKGTPYTCPIDSSEKCYGGALYGWGISHEIGHVMDQSNGAYPEISNNVVALYSSTIDETSFSRIGNYKDDYTKIYEKVTSNTIGYSSSVFTQLGMYWQLHLAYDDQYIRPNDTSGVLAKMYQAYRHHSADGADKDNLLIRMASVGAGKDLSDYFKHWGLVATEETKQWLKDQGLMEETKPIYYLNETARRKRIEGTAEMAQGTTLSVTLDHDAQHGNDSKQAVLHMSVDQSQDAILGYEIYRNGEVIAFTNEQEFKDTITTSNNRVYTYEVIAYDYALQPTNKVVLDPIKISHDGSINKQDWVYQSNAINDQMIEGDDEMRKLPLDQLFDGNYDNTYEGKVTKGNVEIIVDMNKNQPVIGFKYSMAKDGTHPLKDYEVMISQDKKNWQSVAKGKLNTTDDTQTVFFTSDQDTESNKLEIFDAQYVKFVWKQSEVSIAELDVLSPPGDNIELSQDEIGILKQDHTYAQGKTIPKGSLVFTGEYRGNPAFNAVLLLNERDEVIADAQGEASSILLATIPEHTPLDEIASGRWIYWIEPEYLDEALNFTSVKAQLYRVDDAQENSGQRLVSDTLMVDMPKTLPDITLTGGK